MATLQKFKFLATQCAIAPSPSRSPNTSPSLHLPRRKTTLRSLFKEKSGTGSTRKLRRGSHSDRPEIETTQITEVKKKGFLSHTLKDLFVSSQSFEDNGGDVMCVGENGNGNGGRGYQLPERRRVGFEALGNGLAKRAAVVGGVGLGPRRVVGLRHRLLRRAWKPVLVTIPE